MSRKVTVIQEHLPHYRVPFFELAREHLGRDNVSLNLIHGLTKDPRFVSARLGWAHQVPIRRMGAMSWHANTLPLCRDSELIIVPQETKYLVSHMFQLLSRMGGAKFAFWGHGKSFQAVNPGAPKERAKAWLSRHVDWWFAYNDLSAQVVRDLGYPAERITSVGNAIDTRSLTEARDRITQAELEALRASLGIKGGNVAVYTGGLYPDKRIGFLIDAAMRIREAVADFELIVIGEGPDRHLVSTAAAAHPWIHDLGRKGDQDKVPYWALAKLLLMPGLVGLVVVDSFALGVPLVTTDYPFHSPEIDYLENDVNGVVVPCGESVEAYATAVVDLLADTARLGRLRSGALASAGGHTIEGMAENFAKGVLAALDAPRL